MRIIKHFLMNEEPGEIPAGGGGEPTPPEATPSILGDGLSFNEGWTDQLTGDHEQFRDMAGQFKDIPGLLKSYHDTRAKLSQRVQAPGEDATPEERAAWKANLGVPDSVDGYEIQIPEKLPEGVELSDGDFDSFKKFAFDNDLSVNQVNKLIEYQIGVEGDMMSQINQEMKAQQEATEKQLQQEWGSEWTKKKELAERAAETFGLGADHELMSNPDVLRMLSQIAPAIGEDKLVSKDDVAGIKSPGDMAYDISRNSDNPYYEAYHDPGHPGFQEAQKRYDDLMREQVAREQR